MADYSFLLGAQPIKQASPLDLAQQGLSLSQMMDSATMRQMTMRTAQQQQQAQDAINRALPTVMGANWSPESIQQAIAENPQAAGPLLDMLDKKRKAEGDYAKDTAQTSNYQAEAFNRYNTHFQNLADAVARSGQPPSESDQKALTLFGTVAAKAGGMDPKTLNLPPIGGDPNAWQSVASTYARAGISPKDAATIRVDLEGRLPQEQSMTRVNLEGRLPQEQSTTRLNLEGRLPEARAKTQLDIAHTRQAQDAVASGEQAFTPAAIDAAASRYNIDGTLPPMGMGKTGSQARSAILNRAAELAGASGISPDDQRLGQIGNKANTAALSKLTQQQTMVGAFEKTFNKNADMALDLSNRVDRVGVPLADKWINAGKRSIEGDPDISTFDVAVKSVVNEYAKIVSGSMGNTAVAEGEIKKAEGLLNAAQSKEQVNAVIKFMQKETQNRMSGFKEQEKELRDRMRGTQSTPAAAPASAPSAPSAGGGFSVTAPDGKTYSFPSAMAAETFKARAGIQ